MPAQALHAELAVLEAESIGWMPITEKVYLHAANLDEDPKQSETVITVLGTPEAALAILLDTHFVLEPAPCSACLARRQRLSPTPISPLTAD